MGSWGHFPSKEDSNSEELEEVAVVVSLLTESTLSSELVDVLALVVEVCT